MTIAVGAGTPVGTYPITVTGNGGGVQQNTTVTLTVTAQQQANFALSALPAALSIQQGNQGNSTITATISGGFNAAITLSAAGVPNGTTVSFGPNPIPAPGSGSSTMTIAVGAGTAVGIYPITVTGNGGGIQQNSTVTLTVTAAVLVSPTWAFTGSYTNNGGSAQNWPVFNQPLLPGGGADTATGQCPTGAAPKITYPAQCAVASILQANSSNTGTISSFYLGWTTASPTVNTGTTYAQSQARSLFIDAPGQIGYGGTGYVYIGGRTSDTSYAGTSGAIQPAFSGTSASDNATLEAFSVDFTQTPPKIQEVASTLLGTQDSPTIEQTVYGIAGMDVSGNTYNGWTCQSTIGTNSGPCISFCGRIHDDSDGRTFSSLGWNGVSGGSNNAIKVLINTGSRGSATGSTNDMAYFAKASYDLKHMIWFLGLSGTTPAQSGSGAGNRGRCVMDVDGNMYGQGDTTFSNFPICGGPDTGTSCAARSSAAMQTSFSSAAGWIAEVRADGSDVVWSTYLSGSGVAPACEGGNALSSYTASNPLYYAACNIAPASTVNSTDFFAGAEGTGFQRHIFSGARSGANAYANTALLRVNPGCNRGGVTGRECIDASTYYGGNTIPSGVGPGGTNGWPQAIRLGPNGDVYVNVEQVYTDPAGCATYPCSTGLAGQAPNGYQTTNYSTVSGSTGFGPTVTMLLDFSSDFSQLKNSTYIGGGGVEYVGGDGGMYIDPSGNVWTMSQSTSVPGYSYAHLFPSSSNAYAHSTDPNGPIAHAYGTGDSGTDQYGFSAAMVEMDSTLHNLLYGGVYSQDNHGSEYAPTQGPTGFLARDMQWWPYNN